MHYQAGWSKVNMQKITKINLHTKNIDNNEENPQLLSHVTRQL